MKKILLLLVMSLLCVSCKGEGTPSPTSEQEKLMEDNTEAPKVESPPPAPTYLSAEESDPNKFKWMQGFPPPKARRLSAIDMSFFNFPALRYSVCHMREFFPTTNVPSAQNNRFTFETYIDPAIDDLTFTPLEAQETMTWKESLSKNYTDGIIILHKGKIVYEKYFGALTQEGTHAAMSVTKTFTGTLGALLVAEGLLDEEKPVKEYIPEAAQSGFGDATVRQVMDMTTAIKYSENYADPNAEVWTFAKAGSPFPQAEGYAGPTNYYEYLQQVKKEGVHGEVFGYRTVNSDMLGWLIATVTNKPLNQVLSEKIWQPLGTDHDAYFQVDSVGIPFAGGGFNANLRDVAKFGQMILQNGRFNNRVVLPASVIEDIKDGGDPEVFAKNKSFSKLKGWSYRNMWWKTNNAHGAFAARGVHGQTIYIDPKAEMVIVRFASHPVAANSANDATSLPAYERVAEYLIGK